MGIILSPWIFLTYIIPRRKGQRAVLGRKDRLRDSEGQNIMIPRYIFSHMGERENTKLAKPKPIFCYVGTVPCAIAWCILGCVPCILFHVLEGNKLERLRQECAWWIARSVVRRPMHILTVGRVLTASGFTSRQARRLLFFFPLFLLLRPPRTLATYSGIFTERAWAPRFAEKGLPFEPQRGRDLRSHLSIISHL